MAKSDVELVSAVMTGSKEAFEVLICRYEKSVRAVALSILKDFHLAQDISQEAFIRCWKKLPSLKNKAVFGPWLMKITKRLALDKLKSQAKILENNRKIAEQLEKPNGKLESEKQQLLNAVMKLKEKQKRLIMLRYFDRYTVKELASVTNTSVGSVTKQLSRARIKLQMILERDER